MTRAKRRFVETKNETIATAKSATDKAAGAAAGTSFMLVLAFRLMTAQTFDARKTFVLGIAITFGFCVELMPELFQTEKIPAEILDSIDKTLG